MVLLALMFYNSNELISLMILIGLVSSINSNIVIKLNTVLSIILGMILRIIKLYYE